MPAACGGDRPRRPPDGGIRAGVEAPAQAATVPLAVYWWAMLLARIYEVCCVARAVGTLCD
jgi:hypothetical protein